MKICKTNKKQLLFFIFISPLRQVRDAVLTKALPPSLVRFRFRFLIIFEIDNIERIFDDRTGEVDWHEQSAGTSAADLHARRLLILSRQPLRIVQFCFQSLLSFPLTFLIRLMIDDDDRCTSSA